MNTVCITNCINDARAPMRATYENLYKWPESDAEFMKTVGIAGDRPAGSSSSSSGRSLQPPVVQSSVSCRQMYLRSYTFSKKESVPERTQKCFGKFKQRVSINGKKKKKRVSRTKRRRRMVGRVKKASFSAFGAMFQKLLSGTTTVDVRDR